MAHKKAAKVTQNNRDSLAKNLGFKSYFNNFVLPGEILIRQRGTQYHAGINVAQGRDFTLYALTTGFMQIRKNVISVLRYL